MWRARRSAGTDRHGGRSCDELGGEPVESLQVGAWGLTPLRLDSTQLPSCDH